MASYIGKEENNEPEYVATLNASRCKTFHGFREEMVKAFSLPDRAVDNTNDISGYIFSSWLGFKKIKIIFLNSGSLRKEKNHFQAITELLNNWKAYWESLDNQNKLNIDFQ
jgi:hypothetical protein